MKKTILIIAVLSATLCQNSILAQPSSSQELNQVELLKQFMGTWKASTGKDSAIVWEFTQFGKALELTVKNEIHGATSIGGKYQIGYDEKSGKLIESGLLINSPNLYLWLEWFNSPNALEIIPFKDISHPEAARWKMEIEFTSPEKLVQTQIIDKKISFTRTFSRLTH